MANFAPPPIPPRPPKYDLQPCGRSSSSLVEEILRFEFGEHRLANDPIATSVGFPSGKPWNLSMYEEGLPIVRETETDIYLYALLHRNFGQPFFHLNIHIIKGSPLPPSEQNDFHLDQSQLQLDDVKEVYVFRCSITSTIVELTFRKPLFKSTDWSIYDINAIMSRYHEFQHLNPEAVCPKQPACYQTLIKVIYKPLTESEMSTIDPQSFTVNVRVTPKFLIEKLHFTEDDSLIPPAIYEPETEEQWQIRNEYIQKLHEVIMRFYHLFPGTNKNLYYLSPIDSTVRNILNDPKSPSNYTSPAYMNNVSNPLRSAYTVLGATPEFTPEEILQRYNLQVVNDPKHRPYYFEAIKIIGQNQRSEVLEMKVAELMSLGEVSYSELSRAYNQFSLEYDSNVDYTLLIDTFKHMVMEYPAKESELRQALQLIAQYTDNDTLKDFLNDKTMSPEEAYTALGISSSSNDEFIHLAYETKMQEATNSEAERALTALKTIAISRQSSILLSLYENAVKNDPTNEVNIPISVEEAHAFLGTSSDTPFDVLIASYKIRIEDNPKEILKFRKVLRTIGKSMKNQKIESFLSGAPDSDIVKNSELPVGLENIGNTCYLNSLLQFYFTINPLRNAVIDFLENSKNQKPSEIYKEKRVGGRVVSKEEIFRSRDFICALADLFKLLITTPSSSIAPSEKLAYLALVQPQIDPRMDEYKELVEEILTEHSQVNDKGKISTNGSSNDSKTVQIRSETSTDNEGEVGNDTVIIHHIDSSSDGEHNEGDFDKDGDTEMISSADDSSNGNSKRSRSSIPSEADSVICKRDRKDNEKGKEESVVTVKNIDSPTNSEKKKRMDDAIAIGGQQDVTECIENVLFQTECAFNATGVDEDGEQLDLIKELFYGTTKQVIEDPTSGQIGESKTERFSMLIVNMEDKPQDIYDVMGTYFDDELVELGKKECIRHLTVTKLPPILQIQIQRVQFNKVTKQVYKSKAPVYLLDTIYLDRYLDTTDPVVLQKRKEIAEWKIQIAKLKKKLESMDKKLVSYF